MTRISFDEMIRKSCAENAFLFQKFINMDQKSWQQKRDLYCTKHVQAVKIPVAFVTFLDMQSNKSLVPFLISIMCAVRQRKNGCVMTTSTTPEIKKIKIIRCELLPNMCSDSIICGKFLSITYFFIIFYHQIFLMQI